MRLKLLAAVLLLATFGSAVSRAQETKCSCPCAHHRKHKAAAHAVHAARVPKAPPAPKVERVPSHPITGGMTEAKAVPLEFDRIYKLNRSIKKGSKNYFSLSLEPGTEITFAMKSLKKSDVGVEFFDPKDASVASLALAGEVNDVKRVSLKPLKTGRYLVTIGSGTQGVGANQVIFKATTAPATVDCAANAEGGGMVTPDEPLEDCFWNENVADTFHFDGKRKEVYRVEVVSPETMATLKLTVAQDRKKKSPKPMTEVSGSGGRVAVESVTLPAKSSYSLGVTLQQPATDVFPYTLTLTKTSAPK